MITEKNMNERSAAIYATIYANKQYVECCRELDFTRDHKELFTGFPRYKFTEDGYRKLISELETAKEKFHANFLRCVEREVIERCK
jgi:hypothetical protein